MVLVAYFLMLDGGFWTQSGTFAIWMIGIDE